MAYSYVILSITLQKGQLKILPSTNFKQHFQHISRWLQGGNTKY